MIQNWNVSTCLLEFYAFRQSKAAEAVVVTWNIGTRTQIGKRSDFRNSCSHCELRNLQERLNLVWLCPQPCYIQPLIEIERHD